jgi:hypothetical protein
MADLTGMMQAAAGNAGGAGEFIAVGHNTAPYFTLLNNNAGTVSLATTYTLPATGNATVAFSPSGDYIAVAT